MYYIYIIYSPKCQKYYIGSTGNVTKRLAGHNQNKTCSTKNRGPWELVHKEDFDIKTAALKREKQIKSYKGGRLFKKLMVSSPSSPAWSNAGGRGPAPGKAIGGVVWSRTSP
ncbi:MAG: GIY-YIG nuclease family protein [Candidatus Omnitrophota bacterium]